MTTIQEMVAKFKERIESDPKFQEFAAELKAKAEAERIAKEEAQATARAKFTELFANASAAKINMAKAETEAETE